jgi:hypothetical protein
MNLKNQTELTNQGNETPNNSPKISSIENNQNTAIQEVKKIAIALGAQPSLESDKPKQSAGISGYFNNPSALSRSESPNAEIRSALLAKTQEKSPLIQPMQQSR